MSLNREFEKLNPMQREAVMATDGPVLVLAGAGSGKTKVITHRIAHLLSMGKSGRNILAVTFTNKASKEMKSRVRTIVGKGKSYGLFIGTFHSVCLHILRQDINHLGYNEDFSIYDTSDQLSLVRTLMSDTKLYDRSVKADSILELITLKKNGINKAEGSVKAADKDLYALFTLIYPKYQETLKILNAVDFDDLIGLTYSLFQKHPEVLQKWRDRFHYIMVDEYQDTNLLQYNLIKILAGGRMNLCVVGDDDQSIYGWRGANIENILSFEDDFPGTKVIKLEQNYRSHGFILKAANGVIKNNKKRMEKSLWTSQGSGSRVTVKKTADPRSEAEWVASRIELLIYKNKLQFDDFAVVYRTNVLSRPFEEALRARKIDYRIVGGTGYFDRKEIKDISAYLKVIHNEDDRVSLLRALNAPKRGIGTAAMEKINNVLEDRSINMFQGLKIASEIDGIKPRIAESAMNFAALIEKYRGRFRAEKNLAGITSDLINEINFHDYILNMYKTPATVKKRFDAVDEFIRSVRDFEGNSEKPSLRKFLETMALIDMLDTSKEKNNNKGVTLISYHSAKGLEFSVVFMVAAEEDIIPHKKSDCSVKELEEERRLFYVGITRAMHKLFLSYTENRIKYNKSTPSQPSRFLKEIPEDVIKEEDNTPDDPEENEQAAKEFFANIKAMLRS